MKKVLLLSLAFILAAQVLFVQFSWCKSGDMDCKPAATVLGVKKDEKTAKIFTGKAKNKSVGYTPGPEKLLENSLYRLEFDAENGKTLDGGNVADLLLKNTCLPIELTNYEKSSNLVIEVVVNQQPIAVQATGLTAALQQIPAEQIKAIEISTNFTDNPDLVNEADIVIQITQVK